MLKLLNHKRAKISSPSKSHLPRNIEDHPRGHKSATSRFPLPKFSKFALCIQHPPLRWMLRDERRTCTYVQVCEGSAQISISGVKSGIRVAEWFHIMLQPEVRERSVQRVSLVFGGRAIRVNARANPVSAPNRRYTRTYTRTWRTPSATPRAASEQRLPVAFGSVATPLAFMDRPFSACWFVRAPPQVHENDLVCVCVCLYVDEGGTERACPGAESGTKILMCIGHLCVGVLPLHMDCDNVCVVCVTLSVSFPLYIRRSRGRHRMGVSPLSDPLTAVGVEAPDLTANVSHIPGLQPVLRRSRPVLSGRWTARKSVSLTTGSCVSCATRIYCREVGRSCSTRIHLRVDKSRTVSSARERRRRKKLLVFVPNTLLWDWRW